MQRSVPTDPAAPVPTDPAAPVPADHASHDTVLVAAYAAGDLAGTELEAAAALVATCASCAALHRDLRAIAAALPELPAPRRTRDFRLTPEQAASLRPAGWRRILAPFAGPRFAFAAPLGSGARRPGHRRHPARRHGPAARQHGIGRGPRGCPHGSSRGGWVAPGGCRPDGPGRGHRGARSSGIARRRGTVSR